MKYKLILAAALAFAGVSGVIRLNQIEGGTSANIPISDGTRLQSRTLSGDVTLSNNTGTTAIGAGKVTYPMAASAMQPGMLVELMNVDVPSGTGVLTYEFRVPTAQDGTSATWTLVNLAFRLSTTSSSGNPQINIQYSTGSGVFSSAGNLSTSNLQVTAGNYEGTTSGFAVPTLASGNKIKVNVVATGTGTAGWSVLLLMRRTA